MGHEFRRILFIQTALVFEGNFKPQLQLFEFYFSGNIISSEKNPSPPRPPHFLIQKSAFTIFFLFVIYWKLVQWFCATDLFNPPIDPTN